MKLNILFISQNKKKTMKKKHVFISRQVKVQVLLYRELYKNYKIT